MFLKLYNRYMLIVIMFYKHIDKQTEKQQQQKNIRKRQNKTHKDTELETTI